MDYAAWEPLEGAILTLWDAMEKAGMDTWSKDVLLRTLHEESQDGSVQTALERAQRVLSVRAEASGGSNGR